MNGKSILKTLGFLGLGYGMYRLFKQNDSGLDYDPTSEAAVDWSSEEDEEDCGIIPEYDEGDQNV